MRALAALGLVLLLAGCVQDPMDVPTPEPTSTPVFASEEEALAAAEEAYAAYQAAVDKALTEGSSDGLDLVASGDALAAAEESVAAFLADGRRQTGVSAVRVNELVQFEATGGDPLQVYACLDISGVHVLDAKNNQVDPPERRDSFPTLVTLIWTRPADVLVVDAVEIWEGSDFCA